MPVIRIATLGELKFYMVSEEELEALSRGSPGSVYLNLALALLPVAVAFLLTQVSTTIENTAALFSFICGCIVCFVAGMICLVLAYVHHSTTAGVVKRIKERMPPQVEAEPAAEKPPDPSAENPSAGS
jgi:hypothetical protein